MLFRITQPVLTAELNDNNPSSSSNTIRLRHSLARLQYKLIHTLQSDTHHNPIKAAVRFFALIFVAGICCSCANLTRTNPSFQESYKTTQTIAVLPPQIQVFEIDAGGVVTEHKEWSDKAKQAVLKNITTLGPVLTKKKWIYLDNSVWEDNPDLLKHQQGQYEAVLGMILKHTYNDVYKFPDKLASFDYTLGADVSKLIENQQEDIDWLFFVYGFDHRSTPGRNALKFWNMMVGLTLGVAVIMQDPSFLSMAAVDAQTGDVVWIKITNPEMQYDFLNEKTMANLVKWFLKDFEKLNSKSDKTRFKDEKSDGSSL